MLRKFMLGTGLAALAIMPLAAASAQDEISTVCLVTDLGRVNDGTFNQYAYEGMVRAAEDFGLESTYIETQSQTDYATNIGTCVDEGNDIIVTVGFLIADATVEAAIANPDVLFIGVDHFVVEPLPNYALAALMTESGVVAGVYGIDIPPVVRFRNGFEQGVVYINEQMGTEVTALGVYIDDFVAPDRGAAAAEQFIGEGADVIMGAGGPTGSGAIAFAASEGVYVIGVDQDEYFTTFGAGETDGADRIISSAIKRVDNGVYQMIEAAVNGVPYPETGMYVLDVTNEGIGYAPANESDVPEDVTAMVDEILAGLIDGSIETGVDPITGMLLSDMEMMPEATPGS
jgi:basic membrane protein A and related proteins